MEWCVILIVIGAVIALEYINSALETIVDMVSPQHSEERKSSGLCSRSQLRCRWQRRLLES